jgi:hypothetical protein
MKEEKGGLGMINAMDENNINNGIISPLESKVGWWSVVVFLFGTFIIFLFFWIFIVYFCDFLFSNYTSAINFIDYSEPLFIPALFLITWVSLKFTRYHFEISKKRFNRKVDLIFALFAFLSLITVSILLLVWLLVGYAVIKITIFLSFYDKNNISNMEKTLYAFVFILLCFLFFPYIRPGRTAMCHAVLRAENLTTPLFQYISDHIEKEDCDRKTNEKRDFFPGN